MTIEPMKQFKTLLEPPYTPPPRELPVALARRVAVTKATDPLMVAYGRIYNWLTWSQQFQFRVELEACRRAQRGETLAEIAS